MQSQIIKEKKENIKDNKQPETGAGGAGDRKANFFDKKRFKGMTEEQEKMLQELDDKKAKEKQGKNGAIDILDEFDDDYDDDPWNMSDNKKKKPEQSQQNNKQNPFDQKVKPAFDDLDEIGFDLDSAPAQKANKQKEVPK